METKTLNDIEPDEAARTASLASEIVDFVRIDTGEGHALRRNQIDDIFTVISRAVDEGLIENPIDLHKLQQECYRQIFILNISTTAIRYAIEKVRQKSPEKFKERVYRDN